MAIDWQNLPEPCDGKPFDGERVLLAVPNVIGPTFGGDGKKLDPDAPYEIYLARWDHRQSEWATTDTNEQTGGIFWLCFDEPTLWADLDLPTPAQIAT